MSEKYIPELKITVSDVMNESDREKLKSYKHQIEDLLVGLGVTVQAKKGITEFSNARYKQKVCQYFLNLISQRQAELNEADHKSRERASIAEDKEIIQELKKHVPRELFLDIVRKVKARLNGMI